MTRSTGDSSAVSAPPTRSRSAREKTSSQRTRWSFGHVTSSPKRTTASRISGVETVLVRGTMRELEQLAPAPRGNPVGVVCPGGVVPEERCDAVQTGVPDERVPVERPADELCDPARLLGARVNAAAEEQEL